MNSQVLEHVPPSMRRKVALALERNTRVMIVRSPDTHTVLDIVKQTDRAVKNLRNRMLISLEPKEVVNALSEYRKGIEALDQAAAKLCEAAGLPYESPLNGSNGKGGK